MYRNPPSSSSFASPKHFCPNTSLLCSYFRTTIHKLISKFTKHTPPFAQLPFMLFGKMASHPSEEKSDKPTAYRLSKVMLVGLTCCYGLSHIILFIMSAVAWGTARKRADRAECLVAQAIGCGHARWALYPFLTFGSLVCCLTSGIMAFRSCYHTKGAPLDAMYVFRGVFFTVLILATLVVIGWTNPFPVFGHLSIQTQDNSNAKVGNYIGWTGTFIFESLDWAFYPSKAAMVMCHINLVQGALIAGATCASAPVVCKRTMKEQAMKA